MGVQYRLLGGARRPLFMTDPASSKSFYPCRWTCIPFHTQGRRELLAAENRGASAHIREPNSHLPEQDKRFKLSANVWFYAIHIGLLFSLPHRKIVELVRTDSAAGQFDDFIHHRPVRHVVPSQPVRASMGRRINSFCEIVKRDPVDSHPALQVHVLRSKLMLQSSTDFASCQEKIFPKCS